MVVVDSASGVQVCDMTVIHIGACLGRLYSFMVCGGKYRPLLGPVSLGPSWGVFLTHISSIGEGEIIVTFSSSFVDF